MPFGLSTALAVFTDLMNREHEVHLKLVLELLKKDKLFVKFSKCELCYKKCIFSNTWLTVIGFHVDPSKIGAMKNWKVPKTPSRIRSFLGFADEVSKVENVTAEMLRGLDKLMEMKEDGGMYFIWVPLNDDVRTLIMDEAHASRYLVHPGTDKTYYDLRDMYAGHV
uniref:Reverse transcriptase domain-containing protein n=1 Tax=Tanacetum cinerariifolium TaxID=118510 RepID=A0A6L2NAQ9_TANCI|nr:hypothetical protein [Tanacetum cinerariifolium]